MVFLYGTISLKVQNYGGKDPQSKGKMEDPIFQIMKSTVHIFINNDLPFNISYLGFPT